MRRCWRLDGYRRQPINTIEVVGLDGDRITLLIVPPLTNAGDAHSTLMAAAAPDNATTVDGLLMINPRQRSRLTQMIKAQDRWESDGGAPAAASPGAAASN